MLNCPDGMNHHNYQLFLSYQELVKEEQSEFQSFIKEVFDLTPELSLAPELRAFVNDSFRTKLDLVAKQNPQKFRYLHSTRRIFKFFRLFTVKNLQANRSFGYSRLDAPNGTAFSRATRETPTVRDEA